MTRCEQLDSLLHERRETLCSLEADLDQVGPVELCELEGASAVDECTPSLGVMEAPGTLVVARFPSVIVPVCVVKGVSAASVLKGAPSASENACVSETPRVSVTACVSSMVCVGERACVRGTACVRSMYVREMAVGMREHATACPGVNVMSRCVSVVASGSLSARVRRRRQQMRDKGRVAAVAVLGTALGLHGSKREVPAVLRTRPPHVRLRE